MFVSAQDIDKEKPVAPPVVHTRIGDQATSGDGSFTITLIAKKQNYDRSGAVKRDPDVVSPKSVNISPDGKKFYINSLEGAKTVSYNMATLEKIARISHVIGRKQRRLWTGAEEIYPFDTVYEAPRVFTGKPVEGSFSHGGRYLWVPYYRRSFDLNAQDPSAIAVIDTRADTLVRLLDTGPLPKMIAESPDGRYMAVAHWGNNTVGIIDIKSDQPDQWRQLPYHVVDYKMKLNYSRTEPVNRDVGSGNALRGTVFTPCSRYLLVGCMGGIGGIAVIDMATHTYKGKMTGMMPNVRHLEISRDGYLYLSINKGWLPATTQPRLDIQQYRAYERQAPQCNRLAKLQGRGRGANRQPVARRPCSLRGMQYREQAVCRGHPHDERTDINRCRQLPRGARCLARRNDSDCHLARTPRSYRLRQLGEHLSGGGGEVPVDDVSRAVKVVEGGDGDAGRCLPPEGGRLLQCRCVECGGF